MNHPSLSASLLSRANNACELCKSADNIAPFDVSHAPATEDPTIVICGRCLDQIQSGNLIANHWHCLNESMWRSEHAIQVQCWRLLKMLDEPWAHDALDMLYLEAPLAAWAESAFEDAVRHKDINGVTLTTGDTVMITKDLDVKGSSIVAKRGTAVRNISLSDNPEHIEGKVNGQRIVILTKFVKKN